MPDANRGLTIDDAVLLLTRVVTLGMGAVAAIAIAGLDEMALSVGLLAFLAAVVSVTSRTRLRGPWLPVLESVLASAIIGLGPPSADVLLPYLIAPAISAGLWFGAGYAIVAAVASFVGLAGVSNFADAASDAQWFIIVLGAGLLAAWLRKTRLDAGPVPEQQAYQEAAALLADLRTLTRPLSGGLDPRPLGAALLSELNEVTPLRRASVVLQIGSDRRRVADTRTSPVGDSPMRTGEPPALSLPLNVAGKPVAWVNIDDPVGIDEPTRRRLASVSAAWALRLEAAALFEEVRELATRAERARLARDLHDGLAQDVASLGLLADDLLHQEADQRRDDLVLLRDRISQLVTELRLSIHDLRDEGTTTGGLSAAISEAARREAGAGGLAVHLRMADAPMSLSSDVETEIFRMAQEALANARRHAQARNLWVSSHTGPGGVVVTIEDDGIGMSGARADRLGLRIMTERASRIGAQLSIRPREAGGTIVEVHFAPVTVSAKGSELK